MCIDDIADCKYVSDIVLNQNVRANELHYDFESYTRILKGPSNAILRREFIEFYKNNPKKDKPKQINNILITIGGSDPKNITGNIIKSLTKSFVENSINIKVLIGALNKNDYDFGNISSDDITIEIIDNANKNMPELIYWSDLVITAAGTTMLEAQYLNTPAACCVVANNQKINIPYKCEYDKAIFSPIVDRLNNIQEFYLIDGIDVGLLDINLIM